MTNTQVAEAFAKGATKGKSGNVFIDGNTIYSYGYHFPMATWHGNRVYVTYRGYSFSTARQLSYVKQALNGIQIVMVADTIKGATIADKLYWDNKRADACIKLDRARSKNSRDTLSNMIARYSILSNRITEVLEA